MVKSTTEKMAEFIMRSPVEFCKECCADRERCNETIFKTATKYYEHNL